MRVRVLQSNFGFLFELHTTGNGNLGAALRMGGMRLSEIDCASLGRGRRSDEGVTWPLRALSDLEGARARGRGGRAQ